VKLPPLQQGILLRRYKRFLADVETQSGDTITVHCPNTGAMTGCAEPGSVAYYSTSDNPKRKYPCTLELVETINGLVSVNTGRANSLVAEALAKQDIAPLRQFDQIKAEQNIPGGGGRFDFLLGNAQGQSAFVEVKSVTLYSSNGLGEFPDAVSERALKHLHALERMLSLGHRAVLIFCAQHFGVERVTAAAAIDPKYAQGLAEVMAAGVEVYAVGCVTDTHEMHINRQLSLEL
jgi:sugar fermentation stimulation protein A